MSCSALEVANAAEPISPLCLVPDCSDEFKRIGIMNDHLRVSYANGSSFASQFLHREFSRRGHDVTLVGPADPSARAAELPPQHVALLSRELHNHPGVHIPFPSVRALVQVAKKRLDVMLGQTCSGMLEFGVWLRHRHRVPYLCVNTFHLPSAYNVLLPDRLMAKPRIRRFFDTQLIPAIEGSVVRSYNASDGLIVLADGMKRYWEQRGVRVPIFVIGRSVEPRIFDRRSGNDPFDPRALPGSRLLVVARHTREKGIERLLQLFAQQIAPRHAEASLTLVGDGPDHDAFRALSVRLGVAQRVFFPGEQPLLQVPDYYRHADLFLYTSLSDTYGQVVSEAAWCGLPCVALDDRMGVQHQVIDGETGVLVDPTLPELDTRFAREVLALLGDRARRTHMGARAAESARLRAAPERGVQRYYQAFTESRRHLVETLVQNPQRSAAPKLAHWAVIHAALLALSYVRPRSVINKNGSPQPGWGELLTQAQ